MKSNFSRHSPWTARIICGAFLWLAIISSLHAMLNLTPSHSAKVPMGYMPVVTNLAAPLVDAVTKGTGIHFEAIKFASFAEMAEAFRAGHIQVAFIIAPLAIALYQQGVPLKVVYIGNRHESTVVVRNDNNSESLLDLAGTTIAVPIRYSGHLLALHRYYRERGVDPSLVRTVEIAPPDMPAALSSGGIDGYFVGEPFASKALQSGTGKRLLDVETIWPEFICNLMIVREELIVSHPQWVQKLVNACVQVGLWAQDHTDETVRLVARHWGQDPKVVDYAFNHPAKRFRFDLYVPKLIELEQIAEEMWKSRLIESRIDLRGMLEDHFAKAANTRMVKSLQEIPQL